MATEARVIEQIASERQQRAARHDLLYAGIGGGLFAGAAMMAFAAVAAAIGGLPSSRPLELVAATFADRDAVAVDANAVALATGALLWAAVSAALGLLYAATVPSDFRFPSAAIMGIGFSCILIAIMTSLVLPSVNPAMRAGMPEMGGAWVLAYAVFGAALGVIPMLRRRMTAQAR
ncbi:MAG TPA: hypothetical protein VFK85_16135 [Anaeromyxobacteraceae bacterium]|nr:hypothetical protein [Anaeromyxobacteraceae bacterium]